MFLVLTPFKHVKAVVKGHIFNPFVAATLHCKRCRCLGDVRARAMAEKVGKPSGAQNPAGPFLG